MQQALQTLFRSRFSLLSAFGLSLLLAACSAGEVDLTNETEIEPPATQTALAAAPSTDAPPANPTLPLPTAEITTIVPDKEEPAGTMPIPTRKPASAYADLEIVTLLPPDAIPAVDDPRFLTAVEADEFYDPDELVMGVIFNGDARAYSAPFLSNREIVNDTVGGVDIAVTW